MEAGLGRFAVDKLSKARHILSSIMISARRLLSLPPTGALAERLRLRGGRPGIVAIRRFSGYSLEKGENDENTYGNLLQLLQSVPLASGLTHRVYALAADLIWKLACPFLLPIPIARDTIGFQLI